MQIRRSRLTELDAIMRLYSIAKQFMNETGNPNQWIDGYPGEKVISSDILSGNSYVCTDNEGEIIGVFYFAIENDPTYTQIYDGAWLNDKSYGVIHRLASAGKTKGIANQCLTWCYDQCQSMRADTHAENKVMQHLLLKNGYTQCGTIIVKNGSKRLAFQK
jgi:hypothetical protein